MYLGTLLFTPLILFDFVAISIDVLISRVFASIGLHLLEQESEGH